jgi:acyl-homoserine lactone acylase PvdQ
VATLLSHPNHELTIGAKVLCSWWLGWVGDKAVKVAAIYTLTRGRGMRSSGSANAAEGSLQHGDTASSAFVTEGRSTCQVWPTHSDMHERGDKSHQRPIVNGRRSAGTSPRLENGPHTSFSAQECDTN